MTANFRHLHSHSGLEKKLLFPKNKVLVDKDFLHLFSNKQAEKFVYKQMEYYRVPIMAFVMKGGVFKNFEQ